MGVIPPKPLTGTFVPQKAEDIFDNIFKKLPSDVQSNNPRVSTPYQIVYQNWYKSIPYALRIEPAAPPPPGNAINLKTFKVDVKALTSKLESAVQIPYFFPVNPESLSISTPYAVNITPTLGGVVEEHSGAVFYNITISGTTGVLPELDFSTGVPRNPEKDLRPTSAKDGFSLGGFAAGAIAAVNNIVSTIVGTSSKMVDGTRNVKSGYTAYHVLYKYIWLYHFTKANGATHNLKFVNFKDNNQYNVAVQNFQLNRDKSRPHLYQYTITMKAWNLKTLNGTASFGSPADRVANLGLETGPSLKAKMFRVINQTKSVLSSAAGVLEAAAQDLAI